MTLMGFKVTDTKPVIVKAYGAVAWRITAEKLPSEAIQ